MERFLRSVLARIVLTGNLTVISVYLPSGAWFDFWTGQRHEGEQHIVARAPLDIIPLFVRAGAIIPMVAVQQYVGEKETGVINLHLWLGQPGQLNWYEDDGASLAYTRGGAAERKITFTPKRHGGVLRFGPAKGAYASKVKVWRVILRGAPRAAKGVFNGQKINGRFDRRSKLLAFEIPNSARPITLQLLL